MPSSLPSAELEFDAEGFICTAVVPEGILRLRWETLTANRIALLVIPRLAVRFTYSGLSTDERYRLQKRFNLETHRGGG